MDSVAQSNRCESLRRRRVKSTNVGDMQIAGLRAESALPEAVVQAPTLERVADEHDLLVVAIDYAVLGRVTSQKMPRDSVQYKLS